MRQVPARTCTRPAPPDAARPHQPTARLRWLSVPSTKPPHVTAPTHLLVCPQSAESRCSSGSWSWSRSLPQRRRPARGPVARPRWWCMTRWTQPAYRGAKPRHLPQEQRYHPPQQRVPTSKPCPRLPADRAQPRGGFRRGRCIPSPDQHRPAEGSECRACGGTRTVAHPPQAHRPQPRRCPSRGQTHCRTQTDKRRFPKARCR